MFFNVIHPTMSYIKSEVYKKTRNHILNHILDQSETTYFSEKDLLKADWKEDREFVLNGFSYDVVSINFINGDKYYRCYIDKKDIIINSILKVSGFFVIRKTFAWRHFDLPLQSKKNIKIADFFTFLGFWQLYFSNFYSKLKTDYIKPFENTYYLSVIFPPPERCLILS